MKNYDRGKAFKTDFILQPSADDIKSASGAFQYGVLKLYGAEPRGGQKEKGNGKLCAVHGVLLRGGSGDRSASYCLRKAVSGIIYK